MNNNKAFTRTAEPAALGQSHESHRQDNSARRDGRVNISSAWSHIGNFQMQLVLQANTGMRIGFGKAQNVALQCWLFGRGLFAAIASGDQPVWDHDKAMNMLAPFFKGVGKRSKSGNPMAALDNVRTHACEQVWPGATAFQALHKWGNLHGVRHNESPLCKPWETLDWYVEGNKLGVVSEELLAQKIREVRSAEITLCSLEQAPGPYSCLAAAVPSVETRENTAGDGRKYEHSAWTGLAGYITEAGPVIILTVDVTAAGVSLTYTTPFIHDVQEGNLSANGAERVSMMTALPVLLTKDHGFKSVKGKQATHSFLDMFLSRADVQQAHGKYFKAWLETPMSVEAGLVTSVMLHMQQNKVTKTILAEVLERQQNMLEDLVSAEQTQVEIHDTTSAPPVAQAPEVSVEEPTVEEVVTIKEPNAPVALVPVVDEEAEARRVLALATEIDEMKSEEQTAALAALRANDETTYAAVCGLLGMSTLPGEFHEGATQVAAPVEASEQPDTKTEEVPVEEAATAAA